MINLIITSNLISTNIVNEFLNDLKIKLSELSSFENELYNFCSICRIFSSKSKLQFNDDKSLIIVKINLCIHSGSLIEDYEILNREIENLTFKRKNDLKFDLIRIEP